MNTGLQAAITLAALSLAITAFTRNASACGISDPLQPTGAQWTMPVQSPGVTFDSSAKSAASRPGNTNFWSFVDPIAGLYQFTFVSDGSNGVPDAPSLTRVS